MFAGLADAVRLATGTLTAVPVPPPSVVNSATAGRAMVLAPVVGIVPGGAAAGVAVVAASLGWSPSVVAVLAVAVLALTTRGLHLDGLADTADGLAASYDRARALAVMRRGDTGPAGAATLAIVLLLQVAALTQVAAAGRTAAALAVLVAAVSARSVVAVACRRGLPAARPEGLGALVAGTVTPAAATVVALATVAGAAVVGLLAPVGWWWPALAAGAALAAGTALLARCVRRFGGITGDVLGACVETGTTAALLVLALAA